MRVGVVSLALVVSAICLVAQESELEQQAAGAAAGGATAPTGPSAFAGVVVDGGGLPVSGAAVLVWSVDRASERHTAMTDGRGRFRFRDLGGGVWGIRVEHDGFQPSEGTVRPGAVARGEPLTVELRSMTIRSPGSAEANPEQSVRNWLEKGNALLEQQQTAAARGEYEKAVRYLAGAELAAVLRAIARTHFLEHDLAATEEALREALIADPEDSISRQLFEAVSADRNRAAGAAAFLRELPELVRRRREEAPTPPSRVSPPAPRPEPAVAHRIGVQTVWLERRSPLSSLAVVADRYGLSLAELEQQAPGTLSYGPRDESFDLFVPEEYSSEGEPWGLVVWVSPMARGGVRSPAVRELLGRRRLIWIGANRAGNPRSRWERAGLALDAVRLAREHYEVDPKRVFVAGYSGGGRMASHLALLFPEVFRGGICWFGVDFYEPVPVPYKPGSSWPAGFPAPSGKTLRSLKRSSRLAIVSGERDFNRSESRAVTRRFEQSGYRHVVYLEIPDADHYHGLDPEWFERALAIIDPRADGDSG